VPPAGGGAGWAAIALSCGRSGFSPAASTGPIHISAVTASGVDRIRPGQYGIRVVAEVTNQSAVVVTSFEVELTFGGREADFDWRELTDETHWRSYSTVIPTGGSASVIFEVDV